MRRGEIWWAALGEPQGSKAGYDRPVLIVQDDVLNAKAFQTVLVVPLTSNLSAMNDATSVRLDAAVSGLAKDSLALATLLTAIDRSLLIARVCQLQDEQIEEIELAMLTALGLIDW